MFCGVLPLVWGVGGAARGAFLTRRTLGSFLMRRGGILIVGAALALFAAAQVGRGPSLQAECWVYVFRRRILFRVRVWTGGSKATTVSEPYFCLLVSYRPASSQPRRKRRAHTELDSSTGLGLGLSTIPRIAPATMPHEQAPSR